MNAALLVDLLLELNVLNPQDLKREVVRMAAHVSEPRARQWFKRMVAYWLINIDKLMATPYQAKAEPRTIRGSKYNFAPSGQWVGPKMPEHPGVATAPEPREEPEGTYTSMLHQPDIEKQMGQNFSRFEKPSPATGWLPGQPPTKAKTPAWASPEKELYHFDPIQVRRRELFERLEHVVNYLNWQHHLAQQLVDPAALEQAKAQALEQAGEEGVQEVMSQQEQAMQAKELFRALETMKTEDINGFRQIMRDAQDFGRMTVEKPWAFTKDAQVVARQGDFKIIKVRTVDTAVMLSKRKSEEGSIPIWCTKTPGHATNYLDDGPLYFVDRKGFPYVLMHFESNQCKNLSDMEIERSTAQEIAPVIAVNPTEFPLSRFQAGTRGFGALRLVLAKLQK